MQQPTIVLRPRTENDIEPLAEQSILEPEVGAADRHGQHLWHCSHHLFGMLRYVKTRLHRDKISVRLEQYRAAYDGVAYRM